MPIPPHILPVVAGAALVVLALSFPLMLALVPRNRWYGVRTAAATQGSDAAWYAINRRGGRALAFVSVAVLLVVALLGFAR